MVLTAAVISGGQRNYRLQRVLYPSDLKLVNSIDAPGGTLPNWSGNLHSNLPDVTI